MHGDPVAARVEDLHLEGAESDDHLASSVGRIRGIPVPAINGDDPLFVGLHPLPSDHVERLGRQRSQCPAILPEQGRLVLALAVMRPVAQSEALVERAAIETRQVPDARPGHEQPAPDRADLRLDRPFLMAGIRVAARVLEPVMGLEALEQLGQPHVVAPFPAAHARGVVVHDPLRDPAQPLENILERLARALRVLPGHQLADADVRIREIQHEMMHARRRAAPVHVDLAEVGPRLARMPHQVQKPRIAIGREFTSQLGHLAAHRRQRHLRAILVTQPLPDKSRRMPLLMPSPPILREPSLDHGRPLVDHRRSRRPHRWLGRQVAHPRVLAHRGLAHPRLPGDRGDTFADSPQLANRLNLGHADHCLSGLS